MPHARIGSIDAQRGRGACQAWLAVLTGADLLDIDPYWGHAIKDRPIVAIDEVRHAGEPVAAVAAVDEATAEAALADHRGRVRGAARRGHHRRGAGRGRAAGPRRPDPPRPVPRPGHAAAARRQRLLSYAIDRGDGRRVFDDRGHRGRGRLHVPGRLPVRHGDPFGHRRTVDAGEITLWATCQHPFLVRAEIAALFDVPLGRVRIIVPYLGGGFGSKSYTKMEPITVALARKAGRPVKIVNRVDESMVTTRRHGAKAWMRTAADRTGRLLAREVAHLVRHRRLRRQRPARDRHRRRLRARARTAGRR